MIMRPLFSNALVGIALLAAAPPAAAQQAAPEPPVLVSAMANEGIRTTLRPGWPLLIRVDLLHRDLYGETLEPVAVSAAEGPWREALRLSVSDAGGTLHPWSFHPAGEDWYDVVLTSEAGATAVFWLGGDETAALAPGVYTIDVSLDSTALPDYAGARSPRAVPIRLTVSTDAASPDDERRRHLLEADLAVARGDETAASEVIEGWLAAHPDDPAALAYRADLLRAAGETGSAALAFAEAVAAYRARHPEAPEPFSGVERSLAEARYAQEHATEFRVTFGEKGLHHPFPSQGGTLGFALDGVPGAEIVLEPGETYTFQLAGIPEDAPFTLAEDAAGAVAYTQGVEDAPGTGDAVVTFTPDESAPDVLYYGSALQPFSGGRLRLNRPMSEPTPVTEAPSLPARLGLSGPVPNPAPDGAAFTIALPAASHIRAEAFDLLGRRIAFLLDAEVPAGSYGFRFETRALPAGSYVVQVVAGGARFARVVVVP